MTVDRRSLLAASFGLGAAAAAVTRAQAADAAAPKAKSLQAAFRQIGNDIMHADLKPNAAEDQTAALQSLIDEAAATGRTLRLPEGVIRISDLRLRAGTALIGNARRTVLLFNGGSACITADNADGIVLQGLIIDGAYKTFDVSRGEALLNISRARAIAIEDVEVRNSAGGGISLVECCGRVSRMVVSDVLSAGIKSLDAQGLEISANEVTRCAGNGILVWRREAGEDGTLVIANRISQIRNALGGTGEWGNGVNVFRAGGVLVQANRIYDCTYSAVRGNAASNIQIISNNCERLGEVALYAEFGFQGCVIANNVVDTAATGISVTNFKEGGRLAVIQGNLIRNLFRREKEPEGEKRGEGIGVEADAAVTGNTIEGAPTVGLQIGWGPYMRDVAATGNVIRHSRVGIAITNAPEAGACLIANNLISQTIDGAIRTMNLGAMSGPDLAREPGSGGRIALNGNVAV
ncbi:MAG: TIGR03808 family TAT-translocated repetitive protein [Hyphomicrobiaceae bacterium]